MVERERLVENKASVETGYYISSLGSEVKQLAKAIRGHWGIENSLHWVLDIAFREDKSRIRKDHAPEVPNAFALDNGSSRISMDVLPVL